MAEDSGDDGGDGGGLPIPEDSAPIPEDTSTEGGYALEVRYNPQIEAAYARLLLGNGDANHEISQHGLWYTLWRSYAHHEQLYSDTPYTHYTPVSVTDGLYGGGQGVLSTAATGARIVALQTHAPQQLWGSVYSTVMPEADIAAQVDAYSQHLAGELDHTLYAEWNAGMRAINAVQSSTYVLGKAWVAQEHLNRVAAYMTTLRLAVLDLSMMVWEQQLNWLRDVVLMYHLAVTAPYYEMRHVYDGDRLSFAVEDRMWNLQLFRDLWPVVATLNGQGTPPGKTNQTAEVAKQHPGLTVLQWTLTGASIGQFFGGYGAAIGAVVGLVVGLAMAFLV